MTAWGGSTTRPQIHRRSTRKVSLHQHFTESKHMVLRNLTTGKYLLEREKLVKENAWKLDNDAPLT